MGLSREICLAPDYIFHVLCRHLDGVIFALRQHFIICTCPSIALRFWQAVSIKTAMSGMSAPSLLIMSVASGNKESGTEKKEKRERYKITLNMWLIEYRSTNRVRAVIV